MPYKPGRKQSYAVNRRKPARLKATLSTAAKTAKLNQDRAIQANISSLSLFLAKYLSGKSNIVISPDPNSTGYSVARKKLLNGQEIFDIHVPHWKTYKLPLDDRSKYRIYRDGVWHEASHASETPPEVYTFGADKQMQVTEPLAHDVINILEDRRIEDIGVEKWRGYNSERLFSNGYAWTRRMDCGAFWKAYLESHFDPAAKKYDVNITGQFTNQHLMMRLGHVRHEAFLQRLLVMKIKGWDKLPIYERDLIEAEARMVEQELAKLRKPMTDKAIFDKLSLLSLKVIHDLELKEYRPNITRAGESSWDQSFESHEPAPGEEEQTKQGIDDYFDELLTVEVICSECGQHYTRKLGTRND